MPDSGAKPVGTPPREPLAPEPLAHPAPSIPPANPPDGTGFA